MVALCICFKISFGYGHFKKLIDASWQFLCKGIQVQQIIRNIQYMLNRFPLTNPLNNPDYVHSKMMIMMNVSLPEFEIKSININLLNYCMAIHIMSNNNNMYAISRKNLKTALKGYPMVLDDQYLNTNYIKTYDPLCYQRSEDRTQSRRA